MSNISDYLTQTKDNEIICKKDCEILINLSLYSLNDNIRIDEVNEKIWVKNLMSEIKFDDISFDLILDYPVILLISDMEYNKKESIKLNYKKDSVLFYLTDEVDSIKQQIPYIERLMGGKELFKDSAHILRKLMSMGPLSTIDSVHLELLISNCLRDRKNINKPARLGKTWDPILINIKDIVFNTSFIQGLEFENVGKAISTGMIQPETTESALEKLLTGDLIKK